MNHQPQPITYSTAVSSPYQAGDAERWTLGLALAAHVKIERRYTNYLVRSQSGDGSYTVNLDNGPFCTCPDFELRQRRCKHIYAVEYLIRQGRWQDSGPVVPPALPKSSRGNAPDRDWSAYNAGQVNEGRHFAVLLRELCNTVAHPPQLNGRPRLPLGDAVFAIGLKVYSTLSARRAMSDVQDAHDRGLLARTPSFTSLYRYIENPELTPVLQFLIQRSALPLQSVERDFAPDSSGFSSSVYQRWFDHKYGRERKGIRWVKGHLMCGVKTNIVTAAAATAGDSADSPFFAPFVRATARNFDIVEVSADKAYLARGNLRTVEAVGGTAYIPFKVNSVPVAASGEYDPLWERAFHYYNLHRAAFLEHYHKRSNVETTFSMIKAKFGAYVRSKNPAAQVNEVLAKMLCHNICVLIKSMYELGIWPVFEAGSPARL